MFEDIREELYPLGTRVNCDVVFGKPTEMDRPPELDTDRGVHIIIRKDSDVIDLTGEGIRIVSEGGRLNFSKEDGKATLPRGVFIPEGYVAIVIE